MKESNGNNDLKSFLIVNKSIDDLHDLIGTEYFYYIYYSILKIIKQIYMNMRGIKQMPGNNNKMLKELLKEDHRTIFTMIQKFGTEEKGQSPVYIK